MDNIAIKKSALGIDQIQNLPQSSIEDIKSTKGASKLLYVAATGVFTLVNMPSQSLKSISIQNKDIETSIYLKNDKSIDVLCTNRIRGIFCCSCWRVWKRVSAMLSKRCVLSRVSALNPLF